MGLSSDRKAQIRRNFGNFVKGAARMGISYIKGMGDYTVMSNTLVGAGAGGGSAVSVPSFSRNGGSIRIAHREFISDVQSSINFTNTTYGINPANKNLFPWLAGLAQNFQEYIIHGMVISFNSLSSDALNSTNTALGAVIMSTDYNAANKAFTSKQQAENSQFTVSGKPSQSLIHAIECDPSVSFNQGHFFVSSLNTGGVPTGEDIKTYNKGLFQFITQGSQAQAIIGELWVSYDIELLKPIETNTNVQAASDHFTLAAVAGGTGNPVGTATRVLSQIGCTISGAGAETWTLNFPTTVLQGTSYLVLYSAQGTSANNASFTATPNANCTLGFIWNGNANTSGVGFGPTGAAFMQAWFVNINTSEQLGNAAAVVFTVGQVPTTATGDIWVIQVGGSLA